MAGYPYSTVESALARVFGVDQTGQRGWLRGRIKHLQRLGLAPEGPGKGRRLTYNDAAVWAWLLALQIEDFGLDPSMIVRLLKDSWRGGILKLIRLAKNPQLAKKNPHDSLILVIETNFLSPREKDWPFDPAIVSHFWASDARAFLEALQGKGTCVFNLTTRLRALDDALRSVQEQENETL